MNILLGFDPFYTVLIFHFCRISVFYREQLKTSPAILLKTNHFQAKLVSKQDQNKLFMDNNYLWKMPTRRSRKLCGHQKFVAIFLSYLVCKCCQIIFR